MGEKPINLAKSVKDRLLNIARANGRVFEVVLVRFALERLLYRLSQSAHRDRFVLKGEMLVTVWLKAKAAKPAMPTSWVMAMKAPSNSLRTFGRS